MQPSHISSNKPKHSFPTQVVQEYERAVIFRIGRLLPGGAKGPGGSGGSVDLAVGFGFGFGCWTGGNFTNPGLSWCYLFNQAGYFPWIHINKLFLLSERCFVYEMIETNVSIKRWNITLFHNISSALFVSLLEGVKQIIRSKAETDPLFRLSYHPL